MAIMDSRRLTTALLITTLVLSCETKIRLDTCVCNRVDLHRSQNISESPCTAPDKPINGNIYKTGDTITYHCSRGYILIGQADRTCNETVNEWQPQEPYCEPEYVGHLKRRLHRIEQRITTLENITSGLRDIIRDAETDRNRSRLMACTNKTNVIDRDTVSKCLTMQLGERNGRSVSVFEWIVEDFKSKIPNKRYVAYSSDRFYHRVPGHTFRLKTMIFSDYNAWTHLWFVQRELDDHLRWPFSTPYDMTVLLNNGTEFLYEYFPGQNPKCTFNPQTREEYFPCEIANPGWANIWKNKEHVLNDGSMVVTLYMYN